MIYKGYEAVIGLEVHIELATESKIFCSCPTAFGAEENTQCYPVCMGMPGSLPVLNERAVELAVTAGLAANCRINEYSRQDRKNYFYPDLPKAYQISQYDIPLCEDGWLMIDTEDGKRRIGITRIHIEEDAGKLIHEGGRTYIDYNRCGVPLVEVVSEPDIRSSEEAVSYLRLLRSNMLFAGVSSCKMNEGKMRCDVNISVRKCGERALGTRTEIKNLNSFTNVAAAIEEEFRRQVDVIEAGGVIVQQTLRHDADSGKNLFMRTKENAYGYRYFRDPDLPPVVISKEKIESLRQRLPMMAAKRKEMYEEKYGLSSPDADVLTQTPEVAEYFERAASLSRAPRYCANLIIGELLRLTEGEELHRCISAEHMAELSDLAECGYINSTTAKKLVKLLCGCGISPLDYVNEHSMRQINDAELISEYARRAIKQNPKSVEDYKKGKTNAKKAISGAVMRESGGYVNPLILEKVLAELL